ncbi:hypothetical protein [Streptomyces zagrosensis]|uniref:Uncharacterized protein n=1 Tax=Streptomyces zagrosensis TaxID=1042984 RepID=A0A7W9QEA9_9ACTN|nr:hypothetical protein [Streptomyces zagrosensis]MBB5938660.1 hypothetical protein [Streptomyces zagrosensis]
MHDEQPSDRIILGGAHLLNRTFSALRAIEHIAPNEVRRPAIRTRTIDLLYTPESLPDLRKFAVRSGAT